MRFNLFCCFSFSISLNIVLLVTFNFIASSDVEILLFDLNKSNNNLLRLSVTFSVKSSVKFNTKRFLTPSVIRAVYLALSLNLTTI